MSNFVTGATGFIGRHLVELLLRRGGQVHVLVREASQDRFEALRASLGTAAPRLFPVFGDLTLPGLGVEEDCLDSLRGKIDHVFHVAGLYDMTASAEQLVAANVLGTRHALALARTLEARCFHHVSSIAVAGRYQGDFREDMFEQATGLDDPYFSTKHEAEAVVRREANCAWRIYRPGIVVGSSTTGEIDKIDGPYYLFRLIKRLRSALPPWFPLVGIEGAPINLVPVDFVARAIDHIAHRDGLDGRTFQLVDPAPQTLGAVMNVFARAAHAPEFALRLDAKVTALVPSPLRSGIAKLPPVRRISDQVLADLGIPRRALAYVGNPTRFDCRETTAALEGSGIAVPPLDSYAHRLWDYWERNLDPELFRDRSLATAVRGKRILITGASSGIVRAAALAIGAAGGHVLLVARNADRLHEVQIEVEKSGGRATVHTADLSDLESCDALVAAVHAQHGGIDVLVNNAGRSIRRSLKLSQDRFHDFQRTMQINYFGALKMIMGFLPAMRAQKRGQIINVSSIGVQTNPPRFSAYVASKAALDAFSRCAASELLEDKIVVTTVYMPLVRTEMIAPTRIYDAFPTISPEQAADMIGTALIDRPKRVATRLGVFGEIAYATAPKAVDVILNTAFNLFPDSTGARGESDAAPPQEISSEAVAFAHLIPGVHW